MLTLDNIQCLGSPGNKSTRVYIGPCICHQDMGEKQRKQQQRNLEHGIAGNSKTQKQTNPETEQ